MLAKIQERSDSDMHMALVNNEAGKSCDGSAFQPVCGTALMLDVRLSAFLPPKILALSHFPLSIQESRM